VKKFIKKTYLITKIKAMRKLLLSFILLAFWSLSVNAQTCATGGCPATDTNSTGQYPTSTFSTTSSSWTTVSTYMNAGNWTLFNVTSGNTYEWTYCSNYGGTQGWDAELTLFNKSTGATLCYADNCGLSGCPNAPYISWTATFTGTVKLLTTVSGCTTNTGSPYSTLVWRQSNGGSTTTTILGIDVSGNQGTITWSNVKAAGYTFAFVKATEGVTFNDADFTTNMTNGANAGVLMSAYHFARPDNNSAADEATHFVNIAGSYIKSCALPPVLDFETTGSLTYSALTTWAEAWLSAVKTATGITPILYTDGSIASNLGSSINTYPLWIADPDGSSTTAPTSDLGVWTNWAFKQYSWTGSVSGISGDVDLDVFNGDMTALHSLMGCTVTGIADKSSDDNFILYPNPANHNITIENTSANNNEGLIFIFNLQGQLLMQQPMSQLKTDIDISGFANGMYFVKVKTDNVIKVKRFVKE